MRKRSKLSRRTSRKMFRHSASVTHVKNVLPRPMRGGIRL